MKRRIPTMTGTRLLQLGMLSIAGIGPFTPDLLALRSYPRPTVQSVQHRYDTEYPVMDYSRTRLTDPVARLQERLERNESTLTHSGPEQSYLPSLLHELGIDPASQLLVFSRTSAQIEFIRPETPRAIYYADDVYVASPPGAQDFEIAAMDPDIGPVFYTLAKQQRANIRPERKMDECLSCHDSYSLTGGGVPRFIVGSGFTDDEGEQISHEGWILTDDRTPLRRRWGGWYVTGTHGSQTHMGNWIIRDTEELRDIDLTRTGNLTDLSALIDTRPYLEGHSDIVALLVFDHQTRIQNVITRTNFQTRTLLADHRDDDTLDSLPSPTQAQVEELAEPLVEALLMVGQPALNGAISGTSSFSENFPEEGPWDSTGRTLRNLELSTRLFRYPCSYVIYSEAFDGLPTATRAYVYRRLASILTQGEAGETFSHLTEENRDAVLEILLETKPEFRTFMGL